MKNVRALIFTLMPLTYFLLVFTGVASHAGYPKTVMALGLLGGGVLLGLSKLFYKKGREDGGGQIAAPHIALEVDHAYVIKATFVITARWNAIVVEDEDASWGPFQYRFFAHDNRKNYKVLDRFIYRPDPENPNESPYRPPAA